MSCLPGTPCYTSTIHTTGGLTGGCNLDPCVTTKLGTDAVFYTGPSLPCSGINPCDNVTLALQKMDAIICNPPALSVTADNGLTKTANNIQLGGTLIQETVITTSHAYTLSLLGLDYDVAPSYILSQTSAGVIRKTNVAGLIASITVNNGLTNTSGVIQMGGPLIIPTTITTGATNTLSITGLQTDTLPDFIITETSGGVIKKITTAALGAILGTPITADNGLTKTGNNIQLGGALIQNTIIDLAGFDIAISDSSAPKVSTILLEGSILDGSVDYVNLGSNVIPSQKYGTAIGRANNILGSGQNGFAAGVANTLSAGSSSYAIGETNTVTTGGSGALGVTNIVNGTHSHSIGYDLSIPAGNIGTFQVGQFNDTTSRDYNYAFSDDSYPKFSVGGGDQAGSNPAERLNIFHVMAGGLVKSKNGYDARSGERGILPAHWSNTGWEDTGGQTFDADAKYIIKQYVSPDDFGNIVQEEIWGSSNSTGYTFISNGGVPTDWTNGSTIVKVGRPTSPVMGEIGFNLDLGQMEYWNGSSWIQF